MKKFFSRLIILSLIALLVFGLGRAYDYYTAGFAVSNITSDYSFRPEWEIRSLLPDESNELIAALDQPYDYLGKGFQSYAFASRDGKYVIKFFKYQAYRLPVWVAYAPPLPAIVKYREQKLTSKGRKFEGFAKSWKIAFEHLKEETGLLYVHLNKTNDLYQPLVKNSHFDSARQGQIEALRSERGSPSQIGKGDEEDQFVKASLSQNENFELEAGIKKKLTLYDKTGRQHEIDPDQMEFCVQRRAELLCETLLNYKANGNFESAKQLISQLLHMIVSENARGLTDNDYALMQNTGVVHGMPVHIDVGEFVINEEMKQPAISCRELLLKTYRFKIWLEQNYPELKEFLNQELGRVINCSKSE